MKKDNLSVSAVVGFLIIGAVFCFIIPVIPYTALVFYDQFDTIIRHYGCTKATVVDLPIQQFYELQSAEETGITLQAFIDNNRTIRPAIYASRGDCEVDNSFTIEVKQDNAIVLKQSYRVYFHSKIAKRIMLDYPSAVGSVIRQFRHFKSGLVRCVYTRFSSNKDDNFSVYMNAERSVAAAISLDGGMTWTNLDANSILGAVLEIKAINPSPADGKLIRIQFTKEVEREVTPTRYKNFLVEEQVDCRLIGKRYEVVSRSVLPTASEPENSQSRVVPDLWQDMSGL